MVYTCPNSPWTGISTILVEFSVIIVDMTFLIYFSSTTRVIVNPTLSLVKTRLYDDTMVSPERVVKFTL